jgi:hypothetical protein
MDAKLKEKKKPAPHRKSPVDRKAGGVVWRRFPKKVFTYAGDK